MTDRLVSVGDDLILPADVKVPAARISDSTTTGRAVLTAADAAAARTAIGAATAAQGVKADSASQPGHAHTAADISDSSTAGRVLLSAVDATAQRAALDVFRRRGTRCAIFGDSHAQGVSPQGGGSDWLSVKNTPVGGNMCSWGLWLSQSRLQFWGNYGIGGERTDQIAARVGPVLASCSRWAPTTRANSTHSPTRRRTTRRP